MTTSNAEEREITDVISTGTETIDATLGGGIPHRTLMLIEGQSAAGKSTLSQQLVWGALESGEAAALYTTEQTTKNFLRQLNSLGLDVSDYFLLDHLQVFEVATPQDALHPAKVFQELISHFKRNDQCRVIVLDSLTTFVSEDGGEQIQEFFVACKSLCDAGKVIICTVHSDAFDPGILTRISSICDAHLRLKVERAGTHLQKTIEVAKIRGAEVATGNISGFEVDPGIGIRIVPISKARA